MSLALSTWQSVLSFAAEYYSPQLPLYYSERHDRILLDMIGHALGLRSYRVAFADVPMPEPITCLETAVIVSRPLVGYYLNQPTKLPTDPIGFVRNVDLLGDMIAESNSRQQQQLDLSGRPLPSRTPSYGQIPQRCLGETQRLPQSVATYDPFRAPNFRGGGNNGLIDDPDGDDASSTGRSRISTSHPTLPRDSRLTDEDTVRVQHLLRLALMVAHWDQHRRRGIPYNTHEGFEDIEGPEELTPATLQQNLSIEPASPSSSSTTAAVVSKTSRIVSPPVTSLSEAERAESEQRAAKRRRRSPLAIAQSSLAYT